MNTIPLRFMAFLSVVIMIFVNLLANLIPIGGRTTAEVSDAFSVLFVPAGYVFSIWGLIYVALIGYSVWQLHYKQEKLEVLDKIAPAVIIGSIANTLWIFLWHNLRIEMTVFAMLTLLVSLIMVYLQVNKAKGKETESFGYKVFVKGTFSLYLGWISVATIANVTNFLYLRMYNLTGEQVELIPLLSFRPMLHGISDEIWAAVMILVAGLLASVMLLKYRDYVFSLVVLWALVGIYVKFSMISIISAAVAVSVLIIIAMMNYVRFKTTTEVSTKKKSRNKK